NRRRFGFSVMHPVYQRLIWNELAYRFLSSFDLSMICSRVIPCRTFTDSSNCGRLPRFLSPLKPLAVAMASANSFFSEIAKRSPIFSREARYAFSELQSNVGPLHPTTSD